MSRPISAHEIAASIGSTPNYKRYTRIKRKWHMRFAGHPQGRGGLRDRTLLLMLLSAEKHVRIAIRTCSAKGTSVTTLSVKIQRRQLPLLGPYVEPRSSTEQILAEVWCRGFNMDCIGIKDDYEDLGGDSLLAASIFVELEKSFGVKIPWALLTQARTIEQLAVAVDHLRERAK